LVAHENPKVKGLSSQHFNRFLSKPGSNCFVLVLENSAQMEVKEMVLGMLAALDGVEKRWTWPLH
jgi:hypothetical protein